MYRTVTTAGDYAHVVTYINSNHNAHVIAYVQHLKDTNTTLGDKKVDAAYGISLMFWLIYEQHVIWQPDANDVKAQR